jgi:hypothetical protein
MTAKPKCAECGSDIGTVQRIEIAWPGARQPHFINRGPIDKKRPELGDRYTPNPQADGHSVALWLHRDCETDAINRIVKLHTERKPGINDKKARQQSKRRKRLDPIREMRARLREIWPDAKQDHAAFMRLPAEERKRRIETFLRRFAEVTKLRERGDA